MTQPEATQIAVALVRRRGDEVRTKLREAQPTTLVAYFLAAFMFSYGLAIIARPITPSNTFLQQFVPLDPEIIGWLLVVWALIVPVIGWLFDSILVLACAAFPVMLLLAVNGWQIARAETASLVHIATGVAVILLLLFVLWLLQRIRTLEQIIRNLTAAATTEPTSQ